MGESSRERRARLALPVAEEHEGIATRQLLREAGLSNDDIRAECAAGRWVRLGCHTVGVTVRTPTGRGRLQWAVWESGSGAVLDGVTALLAAGLTGWQERVVHVTVPSSSRARPLDGVRAHRLRETGPTMAAGLPRTRPEVAALRAAAWATSDRQAATILAMVVQQRLAAPGRILRRWQEVRRSPRRAFLDQVIRDVCDGAHSLGELDFAALCRARGLPEPTRQVLRKGPRGRVYLDVWWEELALHVEIDGVQHGQGLASVEDALRQNSVALDGGTTLRIPLLGLRVCADAFLDQVQAAILATAA